MSSSANGVDLLEAIHGHSPRSYEGAEVIVEETHKHLFRKDGRGMGSTKLRCAGVLESVAGVAKKLPVSVQVTRQVALSECHFVNGRWSDARAGMNSIIGLCQRDGCAHLIDRVYRLARRWLWPTSFLEMVAKERLRAGRMGPAAQGYLEHLTSKSHEAERLRRTLNNAAPSVAKRRGKTGFLVEAVLPGGAAEAAGLLPGDVLISIGRKTLRSMADYEIARTAKGRLARVANAEGAPNRVFFLRGGLGHERSLGKQPIRARVLSLPKEMAREP